MLTTNSQAPDFLLEGSDGKKHSLEEFKGQKVVLYFYPKDMTSGCTKEAQIFASLHEEFKKYNAVIIGVSKDSIASHQKFIAKENLPFLLLSDSEGKMLEAYDVYKEKSMYGRKYFGIVRSTFLIDEEGKILQADYNVKATESPNAMLCSLKGE